jgi:O-antigen ligase
VSVNTVTNTFRTGFVKGTAYAAPSIGAVPKSVRYAFLVFVFSIPFQSVELPYIAKGMLSLANLSGLAFFGLYLFHVVIFRKSLPEVPVAIRWFIGYFVVYAFVGSVLDEEPGREYLTGLVSLTQIIVFFWCASDLLKDQRLAKSCLLVFALAGVVLAVGGLLNLPGFVPEVRERTRTLGMNPNRLASLMTSTAIILGAFCLTETHWTRVRKAVICSLMLPVFSSLVSTASRAAVGGFVIGALIFLFGRGGVQQKLVASLLTIGAIATLLFLLVANPAASRRWERFFQEGDTAGREEVWPAALEIIGEKPFFGWGRTSGFEELADRLAKAHERFSTHNFVLHLLIEVGVVGTVTFLVGLGLCLWAAWRAREGPLGILPLALMTSVLTMMMTHTGLTAKQFWLFLALALAAAETVKRRIVVKVTTTSNQRIAQHKPVVHGGRARPRRR